MQLTNQNGLIFGGTYHVTNQTTQKTSAIVEVKATSLHTVTAKIIKNLGVQVSHFTSHLYFLFIII